LRKRQELYLAAGFDDFIAKPFRFERICECLARLLRVEFADAVTLNAFAALRDVMSGSSTQNGLEGYLVFLSVCQTCKYMGVDFLDFLRSGENDIHAFAESRRGRRRQPPTSQPTDLPADAIPEVGSQP
jgi:hypothetical protein